MGRYQLMLILCRILSCWQRLSHGLIASLANQGIASLIVAIVHINSSLILKLVDFPLSRKSLRLPLIIIEVLRILSVMSLIHHVKLHGVIIQFGFN